MREAGEHDPYRNQSEILSYIEHVLLCVIKRPLPTLGSGFLVGRGSSDRLPACIRL
jgi:hypothetical protein